MAQIDLKVGDMVIAYDEYNLQWSSFTTATVFATTTITKIDEKKGWYYTPLGKFKRKNDAVFKKVSEKGAIDFSLNSNKFTLNGEGFTIYNGAQYSGFTADLIIPYDLRTWNQLITRFNETVVKMERIKAKEDRTTQYKKAYRELEDKLSKDMHKKLHAFFRDTICARCINKSTCESYNRGGHYMNCSDFDVEE